MNEKIIKAYRNLFTLALRKIGLLDCCLVNPFPTLTDELLEKAVNHNLDLVNFDVYLKDSGGVNLKSLVGTKFYATIYDEPLGYSEFLSLIEKESYFALDGVDLIFFKEDIIYKFIADQLGEVLREERTDATLDDEILETICPYVATWLENTESDNIDKLVEGVSRYFIQWSFKDDDLVEGTFSISETQKVNFVGGNIINDFSHRPARPAKEYNQWNYRGFSLFSTDRLLPSFVSCATEYIFLRQYQWKYLLDHHSKAIVTLKTKDGSDFWGLVVFPLGVSEEKALNFLEGDSPTVNSNLDGNKTIITEDNLRASKALFLPAIRCKQDVFPIYLCEDNAVLKFTNNSVSLISCDGNSCNAQYGGIRLCKMVSEL